MSAGPASDLMLDVIAGHRTASLRQLQAWREDFGGRLAAWKASETAQRVNDDLADAYRARIRQSYLRSVENAEMILAGLDRRIAEAPPED